MRILVFAAFYPPHLGGYEKNIHEWAKRLRADVSVITCVEEGVAELDGVEIIRLPSRMLLGGTYPVPRVNKSLMRFMLRGSTYDVVVTQTRFFTTSLLGYIYARWHHIPLIHVERGSQHSVTTTGTVNCIASLYDHTMGRMIVRGANVAVGVSDAACRFVVHLGAKATRVIYNGIS